MRVVKAKSAGTGRVGGTCNTQQDLIFREVKRWRVVWTPCMFGLQTEHKNIRAQWHHVGQIHFKALDLLTKFEKIFWEKIHCKQSLQHRIHIACVAKVSESECKNINYFKSKVRTLKRAISWISYSQTVSVCMANDEASAQRNSLSEWQLYRKDSPFRDGGLTQPEIFSILPLYGCCS